MYDLLVIGAGPGGYVAAIRAAQLGMKVACVEKRKTLGGTCLNAGCIPSKTLLSSTESYWKLSTHGEKQGIICKDLRVDFQQMMARKEEVVLSLAQGISGLFQKNRIDWIQGSASFLTPTSVQVGTQQIEARSILLATGSEAVPLPFLPFDEEKVLSSTGVLALSSIPKKLLIIGAGVIAVELGSVYLRLGSEVECVEFFDRVCPASDRALSKELEKILTAQGMLFQFSYKVTEGKVGSDVTLTLENKEGKKTITADKVLVAIGRRPHIEGLNLSSIGIALDPKGKVPVNNSFQTILPHIFAIGDLIDGPMLAHKASEEGVAVAELLAGLRPTIDYFAIPNVVYTFPELASVGLTEEEAKEKGLSYKSATFPLKANSRARSTGEDVGFIKMIAHSTTRQLLGIHILSPHASELIAEATLAIQTRQTVAALLQTCHAHPTLSEALKECALALFGTSLHS